jgi:thiol-disulfide isomerase/thioredoxin
LAARHFAALALLLCAKFAYAAGSDSLFAATLVSADDKPVALEAFRGKPLLVNFWARWCSPCRTEIPELIKAHDKYGKQGLVVLGIGLEEPGESVRDFIKAYEMAYPLALAKDKGIWLMQTLGNSRAGLPFTLAIDRKGEIVMRKLGVMTAADIDAAATTVMSSAKN